MTRHLSVLPLQAERCDHAGPLSDAVSGVSARAACQRRAGRHRHGRSPGRARRRGTRRRSYDAPEPGGRAEGSRRRARPAAGRQLRNHQVPRPRRHGRGLSRPAKVARSARRGQDRRSAAGPGQAVPHALRARGVCGGPARPSQCRAGLRFRHRRGDRLVQHGVCRRPDARQAAGDARQARCEHRGRLHPPGGARAGIRSPARHGPPRHQARQPDGQPARHRQGCRPRPGARARHGERSGRRHRTGHVIAKRRGADRSAGEPGRRDARAPDDGHASVHGARADSLSEHRR